MSPLTRVSDTMRHDLHILGTALLTAAAALPAPAQDQPSHFPLDHRVPVGTVGRWNVIAQRGMYGHKQIVQVSVAGGAQVTFFDGTTPGGVATAAPAEARLLVGHAYRLKISDMPEFPGVELYPTVELVDRLHAPADREQEFAVPIELTAEEIESVLQDRMVTKVVYMERQDLPRPNAQPAGVPTTEVAPHTNLLQSAWQMGRPVAILRVGGRTPVSHGMDDLHQPVAPVELVPARSDQP